MSPFQADILWDASWVSVTAENLEHRRLSEHNKSSLFAVTIYFFKDMFIESEVVE